jgi:hypothetical protein
MRAAALVLTAILAPLAARAGELLSGFSSRGEIQVYREAIETWARSPFNRVASVDDNSWIAEWRPDRDWRGDHFEVALRPRTLAEVDAGDGHGYRWINEGWLRLRPLEGLSLQVGREALLWGPAMFWNPSDPFFTQNNRANPELELGGKDFVRGRWQWSHAWALSVVSQVGRGHNPDGPARRDAIKLDWTGESASAALLAAATEPGGAVGWYGWAQWTASDSLLLYSEAGWGPGISTTVPVAEEGPTGWRLVQPSAGNRTPKLLAGGAYTFANGWSLNAELWHNGDGFADGEAQLVARAVDSLGRQPSHLADAQLGALFGATPRPFRRNYAGLQLMNSGDVKTSWMIRYTRNLDDGSGEAVAQLKRDLGDRVQVWVNVTARHGGRTSEYGRWVRNSVMLGVTWFI